MKKYLHKSVTFNPDQDNEIELWKQLKFLPHGEFSRITKKMWEERLKDR